MYRITTVAIACFSLVLPATAGSLVIGSSASDPSAATFEIHDDSGALVRAGNLSIPRALHTATRLGNGSIFVAGGVNDTTSWQIFDQNGNVLSSGLLRDARSGHAATLLTNGNVFLAGGTVVPGTWEIHTPTGSLAAYGYLKDARRLGASAVTLQNGNVWVSGSALGTTEACTWEIHDASGALVSWGSLTNCFAGGQVQVLTNGNVILLGGDNNPAIYEIRSQAGAFIKTGSLANAFNSGANSVLLTNGNVFIFGSCSVINCSNFGSPATWEIRDGNGNFVSTGSLRDPRDTAGAAVLSNGNVFITGGNCVPASWEIRSATGGFVSYGSLVDTRRGGHTLTHF